MAVNDALGTRMKEYYENIPKTKLTRRTPVAIRLDGKAFHTFTRGFQKPFDEILISTMQRLDPCGVPVPQDEQEGTRTNRSGNR